MLFVRFTLMASLTLTPLALAAADQAGAPGPVDVSETWDLSLIYPTPDAWKASKEKVAAGLPGLGAFKGRLGESPAVLLEALETSTALRKEFARLYVYAGLKSDEDTRDAANMERVQELGLLGSEFSRATSYMSPEILAVGADKIEAFIKAEPRLAPHAFDLRDTLRNAPHTLGAEAEGVLAQTGMLSGTASSLYGMLANADMPWPTVTLSDGTTARLDQSGYTKWRSVPNRDDRKAVFTAFWAKMKEYERTFGVSLFSQVKADWFYARVRKHPSSLASALSANHVPEAVYRTLLAETNANLPTLHRYFRLRARMLGVSDLGYHDIYPALAKLDKKFSATEARRLTLSAVDPLGSEYTGFMKAGLEGRYMHTYPQPGKRAGAYMNGGAYDVHPFVLMNYNDDYESVSTLAHEWGHALHSRLANTYQPYTLANYSIFTAEIASTVNEALLLDQMLKIAANDEERLYYLGNALEGLRGTFFRQAMFAEFELAIHEEVEKGSALSGKRLTEIYGGILRRHHGQAEGVMKVDDSVCVEWAYIPHFYRGFYVYQYATSIAAAQLFADKITRGEPGAVETYLGLLKAGGSDYPYDLVKRAGVDLASPEPYRALVARMNRIMDEIEAILAKRG
jgi:oligoendopeptidase F